MATITRDVPARDGTPLPVRVIGAPGDRTALVLAPGAGSSMSHPSLAALQERLGAAGVTTATFDFPYRVRGRRAPDRMPELAAAYAAVVAALRDDLPPRLFLGGRSMGGRVASHAVAAGTRADGLVFLAFPLHPPGTPGIARAAHLAAVDVPMLFLQGTRDTFATGDLLAGVVATLPHATLHVVPDADHGFHVPKRTGRTDAEVQEELVATIVAWVAARG